MLLVFGSINVDFLFPVAHLPQPGNTLWSHGRAAAMAGGRGANQAVAASRDGAAVTLFGAVGDDMLADTALEGLRRDGVDLRHVMRVPGATGRSAITVDMKGRTTIVVDSGANVSARAAQVPDRMLGPRTTLLVQLETDLVETAALIGRAHGRGCRVIVNVSPGRPIDTSALRDADLLIGDSDEIAWMGEHIGTGNNPASLHAALGVPTVRMMGAQGAEAMGGDGYMKIPAMPVIMRDTTAAADCFTGVLAASLDHGANLYRAMRRASVAAALTTTQVGGQDSMPWSDAIDAALPDAPHVTTRQPEITG